METKRNATRVLIFIAFVIVVSWAVALVVKQAGLMETSPMVGIMVANYIIIFLPALANVFTRLVTKEGWGNLWLRPNFKRGWKFYLAAWLLPLVAALAGGGLFYLIFPSAFDPTLGEVRKAMAAIPTLAAQPWLALLIIFFQSMTMAAVINGIASIGEEFGWRAYLLQKLMVLFAGGEGAQARPNAGARRAALLIGVIWGVWHFPLFFLAAQLTLPFALVYILYTCSASVLLCWVTLRSHSVWPASLGHGMLNASSVFPTLVGNGIANPLLGPGPTSLIGMLGYLILALALLANRKAFSGEQEARVERAQAALGGQSV